MKTWQIPALEGLEVPEQVFEAGVPLQLYPFPGPRRLEGDGMRMS